jgi:hypothetical protein
MSAHTCSTLTDGCYRCDLHRDEIEAVRAEVTAEAQEAWLAYRDGPMRHWPRRQIRRREFVAGYLAANGVEATS